MRSSSMWVTAALAVCPAWSHGADCNRNGIDDLLDIREPAPAFQFTLPLPIEASDLLRASDADLDGDPDILALGPEPSRIRLLSNDSGRFTQTFELELSRPALDMQVKDLDADGDGDIVVAMSAEVRILWNDGGVFGQETVFAVGSGPFMVLTEDLDGDDDLDLISGNLSRLGSRDASISVMESLGNGAFLQPRNFGCPLSIEELVAADIDGDGDRDLAAAGGQELAILENLGSSRFDASEGLLQLPARVTALTALDLERDGSFEVLGLGNLSLVVIAKARGGAPSLRSHGTGLVNPVDAVPVKLGNGPDLEILVSEGGCDELVVLKPAGGSFLERPVSLGRFPPGKLALADFDGDGTLDVAAPAKASFGRPRVAFQSPVRTSWDCNANAVPDECEADCDGNGIADDCDIAARDCNANGLPDACDPDCDANRLPDDCEISRGNAEDCNSNSVPDSCEASVLDRDRNGKLDECELAADSRLDCNGNGMIDSRDIGGRLRFTFESYPAAPTYHHRLVAADLDADGDLDLVAADLRTLTALENDSDGAFGARRVRAFAQNITALVAPAQLKNGVIELVVAVMDGACARRARLHVLQSEMPWSFALTGQSQPIDFRVEAVAAGDLDGSGEQDLVCSQNAFSKDNPSHIWLVLRRNGVFEEPSRLGPGGGEVVISDLDGDGHEDVAAASGMVLLGSGDGRFRHTVEQLPRSGSLLRARDLDRDGLIDLVLAGSEIHFLHGTGNGLFEERNTPVPRGSPELEVLDFDDDGFQDLVLAGSSVSVYLNDRSGLLYEQQSCSLPGSIAELVSGDFDSDGDLDLASAAESSILVIRNEGGRMACSSRTSTDGGELLRSGDLDGDGDIDLATAAGGGWNHVLFDENDGRGSFSRRVAKDMEGWAWDFLVHDLSGSPLPDIVKAKFGEALLFENKGDWRFELVVRLPDARGPLAALDLDGDGDGDLASRTISSLVTFENLGSGVFAAGHHMPTGFSAFELQAADLDGNGLGDLILGTESDVRVWLRTDAREFRSADAIPTTEAVGSIATGDLDDDGDTDLVFSARGIDAAFNRGDGTFEGLVRIADKKTYSMILADLDADGDLDVAAGFSTPRTEMLLFAQHAEGGFHEASSLRLQYPVTALLAADVDGSGAPDLAFIDDNLERYNAWHLNVALNLTPPSFSSDRDHDGIPDECTQVSFSRGDSDQSGAIDISDPVFVLDHLFRGGLAPECLDAADAGDDGLVNLSDPVLELLHLFGGVARLPEPFGACGLDGTPDALGCHRFGPCE